MSDARTRTLEREALTGDREAMARLLIEEGRAGRQPPSALCALRRTHRWTTASLRLEAFGTLAGVNVCVDCRVSEVEVRERALDAPPPDRAVTIADHVAIELLPPVVENDRLHVRMLCGYVRSVHVSEAMEAWSTVAEDSHCQSCARARPERRELALKAGPAIHEALRELVTRWVPPAGWVVEKALADPPPFLWLHGRWVDRARKRDHLFLDGDDLIENDPPGEAP